MRTPHLISLAFAVVVLLAPGLARADAGTDDQVRTLETQLNQEHAELQTKDCDAACRALASIRRAAEKICALEQGPRCDAARAKLADATKHVREACPDCALAAGPSPPAPEPATQASAPPAEKERGGCRSCADAPSAPVDGSWALLVLATMHLLRRRSRKS